MRDFVLVILLVVALVGASGAQIGSALKPPPGARVAVVMFEDMQDPSSARNYRIILDAAETHHVPVVLRDFPDQSAHRWSFDGAVWARFFDTKSATLGDRFRGYVFQNQPSITGDNLRQYVVKFADANRVALPFTPDPEGKLKERVTADHDLGLRLGVQQAPVIFAVTNTSSQLVQTPERLSQTIDDMLKHGIPAPPER